jgi:hypothetical protein
MNPMEDLPLVKDLNIQYRRNNHCGISSNYFSMASGVPLTYSGISIKHTSGAPIFKTFCRFCSAKSAKGQIIYAPEQAIHHGTAQNEGRTTITNLSKRPFSWNRCLVVAQSQEAL